MSDRRDASRRAEALHRAIAERLAASGWTAVERVAAELPEIGKFSRPLGDGFSATAIFPSLRNDRSGELIVVGRLGIDYEPAAELLAALVGSRTSGLLLNEPTTLVTITSATEVSDAADKLTSFIRDEARQRAGSLADIDSLIGLLRERLAVPLTGLADGIYAIQVIQDRTLTLHSAEAELVPALLAAVGRSGEARRALTEGTARDGGAIDTREYRRFRRQLRRLLDAGGQVVLPTTPAIWPPRASTPRVRPSFSRAVAQARNEAPAWDEALAATRASSFGKSREEIKTQLERELTARNVVIEPLLLENRVDDLMTEQQPLGRARVALDGFKALRDFAAFGIDIIKAGRADFAGADDYLEPTVDPDWSQLPDRAAYPVRRVKGSRWAAVDLDQDAQSSLNQVAQNKSIGRLRRREVKVWLSQNTDSRVAVHIGTRQVGILKLDAAAYISRAMEAAAERDEDPWILGRLSVISAQMPYLLEVALPPPLADDELA